MGKKMNTNYNMNLQNKKTLSYDPAIIYEGMYLSIDNHMNMKELCC